MDTYCNKFILELEKNGVNIPSLKILPMLLEVDNLFHEFGSICTKEQLVYVLSNTYVNRIASILKKRDLIPGYLIALQVGKTNIQMMDGFSNYHNRKEITENSLFDIASCTKLFTQIVIYKLIDDGFFTFDSSLGELDDRFSYLGDLKVRDVTQFLVEFKTDKRLEDAKNIDEFYQILHRVKVVKVGDYNYNDIGMMVMKEVVEKVTGKSYSILLDYYIFSKLGLTNTFTSVPKSRFSDITGTANIENGFANDPKAALNEQAIGHAGIFANGLDLLKLSESLFLKNDFFPAYMRSDLYEVNSSDYRRSKMGNLFTYHPAGLLKSYVSNLESQCSFQAQGSTRVAFGASKFTLNDGVVFVNSNAILMNPCSMDLEYAKYLETQINKKLLDKFNKSESSLESSPYQYKKLVKNFIVNDKKIQVIDPRLMVDKKEFSDPIMDNLMEFSIKLMYLETLYMKYQNRNEEVKIIKKVK